MYQKVVKYEQNQYSLHFQYIHSFLYDMEGYVIVDYYNAHLSRYISFSFFYLPSNVYGIDRILQVGIVAQLVAAVADYLFQTDLIMGVNIDFMFKWRISIWEVSNGTIYFICQPTISELMTLLCLSCQTIMDGLEQQV